jgi:hypothetical protein
VGESMRRTILLSLEVFAFMRKPTPAFAFSEEQSAKLSKTWGAARSTG